MGKAFNQFQILAAAARMYQHSKPHFWCVDGHWRCRSQNKFDVVTGIGPSPKLAYEDWKSDMEAEGWL